MKATTTTTTTTTTKQTKTKTKTKTKTTTTKIKKRRWGQKHLQSQRVILVRIARAESTWRISWSLLHNLNIACGLVERRTPLLVQTGGFTQDNPPERRMFKLLITTFKHPTALCKSLQRLLVQVSGKPTDRFCLHHKAIFKYD